MNTAAAEEFVRPLPPAPEPSIFEDATLTNGSAVYDKFPVYEESDCRVCPNCHFESSEDFYNHHKAHIQLPKVVLQRLKKWYIKKLTSRNKVTHKLRKKCELAKKHTQSHSPIKLTLKLASGATSSHRSFEVVPHKPRPTVLFGPGDYYTTQGYSIEGLKVEYSDNEYSEEASVEGSIEPAVEAGERLGSLEESTERPGDRSSGVEESSNGVDGSLDGSSNGVQENLGTVEQTRQAEFPEEDDPGSEDSYQDEEGTEEEEEEDDVAAKLIPDEVGPDLDTGAKLLEAVCQETTDSLNREFSDSNGSNSLDAPSPTPSEQLRPDFLAAAASPAPSEAPAMVEQPQPSPDAPANADNTGEPGDLEKTADDVGGFETTSFQWSSADVGEPISTPSEDIDPLQLPGVPPVTVVLSDAQLALGSEYISLDRLGDSAFSCEICGERASSKEMLDEHRCKAGHYKCTRPECGNKVFPNSEELAAHLRNSHSAQFPRPPMVIINQALQSPPVQQLQQQVQRLPMPQPQSYLTQALSSNLPPLGPMMHGAMPPPSFANDASRRPPPLYNPVQQQQQQQYNIAALNQLYGQQQQQYRPVAPQFQQPMRQPTYMQQPMQHQRMPLQQQQPRMQQQQRPQMQQKRPAPLPQAVSPQAKQRRLENDGHLQQRRSLPESMMHLPEAITLSVRQPNPSAVTVTPIPKKQSDAKAVANVLASRGITVTPASNSNSVQRQAQRQGQRPNQAVAALNLNSAISIVATGNSSQQGFAVPQNRSRTVNQVERPPRPPTVDLTGDSTPMSRGGQMNMRGGGRMRGRPPGVSGGRHACQVCDKAFSTEESLQQHMVLHRSPNKLPYRCNLCAAQYPTQQGLMQHRQTYHKEPPLGPEIAVPVVDLKQPGVLQRLANLGIAHYIPLSQLSSPQGGHFGLPIVSVDGARDPAVSNLSAMGASNILSLGPLKPLQR